jgi:hypothetical protein
MNDNKLPGLAPNPRPRPSAPWRRLRHSAPVRSLRSSLALLLLMLCAVPALVPLASCGGGGVGEGGTGYTSGPITGFGSVIVNDITFDDSSASVEDSDGAARLRTDLRLGMTVEIDSDGIKSAGSRAGRVRFFSAITGPVEGVAADGFVVLGQRVVLDTTTFFDAALARGLPDIAQGQIVDVYGLFDAGTQRFRATRVERRIIAPLRYSVRGLVTGLNDVTLQIGSAFFAYRAAANVPSDLAVGSFVRLVLDTSPVAFGRWPVQRFLEAQRALADLEAVSLKGYITSFTSLSSLRVDGRLVDAGTATVSGGPLALGQRVEVNGTPRAGVLVATSVAVRSDADESQRGFQLRGAIESLSGNPATSLVLRGITVGLTRSGLQFDGGTAADLVVGRQIEVRGVVTVGDGTRLDALVVKFR